MCCHRVAEAQQVNGETGLCWADSWTLAGEGNQLGATDVHSELSCSLTGLTDMEEDRAAA